MIDIYRKTVEALADLNEAIQIAPPAGLEIRKILLKAIEETESAIQPAKIQQQDVHSIIETDHHRSSDTTTIQDCNSSGVGSCLSDRS